ncbi:MAG: hypothetical protein AB8U31_02385, partial [Anaplasma ovis]
FRSVLCRVVITPLSWGGGTVGEMTIDVVTTTRAKQSASTETAQSDIESGFKAIADEAKDITNALSEDVKQHNQNLSTRQAAQRSTAHTKQSASTGNTAAVDQGNETATSPSPSTGGDGSAIQSGSVQHATGSSATLKLKSAPDQAMRDAVPSPWSLINAGEHHSNNSRNAQSGDIREFCSKYLCRGTDKREGLLNFIKASIDTPTSIEVVKGNDTKLRMRVTGPTSSDPSQVASVVLTETHDFVVRGTNNKEVGTLEAEVQYTVTPTIEQDKYRVSDLTVKIKSTDSTDPELTYTSTNTSEVSLPSTPQVGQDGTQDSKTEEAQQNSGGSDVCSSNNGEEHSATLQGEASHTHTGKEEHDQQITGAVPSGTGSDEKEATAHGEDASQVGQVSSSEQGSSSTVMDTSWSTFSGATAVGGGGQLRWLAVVEKLTQSQMWRQQLHVERQALLRQNRAIQAAMQKGGGDRW